MSRDFAFALNLPPGINTDDTTFAASGRWADCHGMRFVGGRPQTQPGAAFFRSLPGGSYVLSMAYLALGGAERLVYGMQTKLYAGLINASPTDITPAGLGVVTGYWSLASFGSLLLASPKGGKLYASTGSSPATHVAQAPAQVVRLLVAPERRQVLAFGCNEEASGTFNGRCIRGSDLEDYANWTSTPQNNAFEDFLEDDSNIVSAEPLGSYIAVWTASSLFLGQFIGDPGQTWRWDKVGSGHGLLSARTVTVHNGIAYWLCPDLRIVSYAPGGVPQTLVCAVSRDFVENTVVGSGSSYSMFANARFDEIWLAYPDKRDNIINNNCTRYIAYSIGESIASQRPVWFRGLLNASAVINTPALSAGLASLGHEPGAYLIAGGQSVTLYGSGVGEGWIQTADQYIDDGQQRVFAHKFIPDFEEQDGALSLTLYVRDKPQSPPVAKGPYSISSDGRDVCVRASGKIMAARIGSASAGNWRLGKPVFKMAAEGRR